LFLTLAPTALASGAWYVDGMHGSDNNDCKSRQHACKTIGHAISLAHSGDSIMVAAATYTENLTIGSSLRLIGSGAKTTIIDGGGVNTVVTISSRGAHVTLSRLTIRNGFSWSYGAGIRNSGMLKISDSIISANRAASVGGGVYNSNETLTISNSRISGNSATFGCTPPGHCLGGGIFNDSGNLTINDSDLSGNTVGNSNTAGDGGGVYSTFGTLTINRSTISGNHAQSGGGINSGGSLTLNNCTLADNSASLRWGSGIVNWIGSVTLQNSIIADGVGGNCSGTMTSNGYNLSSDDTCNFNGNGDLNNTDPKLGQLGDHGGPTQTIPLLSESPAIDAGNPGGCTDGQGHLLKTDRGKPRPDKQSGRCDMGAFERQKH
jgi:hypothetical protein